MPSLGTIVVVLILAAVFALAIRHIAKTRKSGGCGCGCSGCSSTKSNSSCGCNTNPSSK